MEKKLKLENIIDKFNENYMDTVYAFVNIFPKSEDGKKLGIRFGLHTKHGKETFVFFYGDTIDGERKGTCVYVHSVPRDYKQLIVDMTPEQVREWIVKICGGEAKYLQMLNPVNQQVWEEAITPFGD